MLSACFKNEKKGEKIVGFFTYDKNQVKLAKNCIYQDKEKKGMFLFHQNNYGFWSVDIISMDELSEAKQEIERHKQIDRARGYIVRE